jgi:hypothetical protein
MYATHDFLQDGIDDLVVCPGVTFRQVFENCKEHDKMHFKRYALLLLAISKTTDDKVEDIMKQFKSAKDGEVSDDADPILLQYALSYATTEQQKETKDIENMLTNSTIGSIAKEIASELEDNDIDELQRTGASPMAVLQSGLVGKLMGRVTSKISSKIESGQLQHDQLLKEAMGLFGSLGGESSGLGSMAEMLAKNLGASV